MTTETKICGVNLTSADTGGLACGRDVSYMSLK
jgi:hypothetical protein